MSLLTQRQASAAARRIPFDLTGTAVPPYEVVDGLYRIVAKQLRRLARTTAQRDSRKLRLQHLMGAV